jgi:iron complex outermembrane receptor protein
MNWSSLMDFGFFGQGDATFDEITPMVSLTRNLAAGDTLDSGIVYFLIAEGFLTGSFNDELNTVANPALEELRGYGPEFVTNYEVGFKGSFLGGRLRLNADIFWMDYTDKQEAVNLDNPDGRYGPDPTVEITQNAGVVDIYGIELELRASPWDGGFVTFDLGYLQNEYSQFQTINPEDPDGPLLDLSGLRIADRQPDWTVNASVGHTWQLANGGSLTGQIGMYAQGEYEWEPNTPLGQTTPCFQDSYSRFRTRFTYVPAAGNWEASLFGNNIGDERYITFCEAGRSGVNIAAYGRPDWWGLEFVARFGET